MISLGCKPQETAAKQDLKAAERRQMISLGREPQET